MEINLHHFKRRNPIEDRVSTESLCRRFIAVCKNAKNPVIQDATFELAYVSWDFKINI